MAKLRNDTDAPAAARSGETTQEVRDRWAGEVTPPMYWQPPVAGPGMNGPAPMKPGQPGPGWNGGPGMGGPMLPPRPMGPDRMWTGPVGETVQGGGLTMSRGGETPQTQGLDMTHLLPDEVVESPTTVNEAYLGSLKSMLTQNKGNYIVATFLVGTQNTVTWEGILYEVGNDYVTIYQPGRDRYIVSDMYSLRYMEFYDIRRQELCDRLLGEQGW